MNQKLFYLLHLAPGKPLQTEEAEKPWHRGKTAAQPSLPAGWQRQVLPPSAWPTPSQAACLHRNLFLAASQVWGWPALGLVLSKPTWGSFNLGESAARDVWQCRARSQQQLIKSLSETEFGHTSFVCWDVIGKCCCYKDMLCVSLWKKKFQQIEPVCSATLTGPACNFQGEGHCFVCLPAWAQLLNLHTDNSSSWWGGRTLPSGAFLTWLGEVKRTDNYSCLQRPFLACLICHPCPAPRQWTWWQGCVQGQQL